MAIFKSRAFLTGVTAIIFGTTPATQGEIRGDGSLGFKLTVSKSGASSTQVDWLQYLNTNAIQLGVADTPTVTVFGNTSVRIGNGTVATLVQFQGSSPHMQLPTASDFTIQPLTSSTVGTGQTLTVKAQTRSGNGTSVGGKLVLGGGDETGASGSRTGGNIECTPGTGATANGAFKIFDNATLRFTSDGTGIGFYNHATAAQAADPGALTDNTTGAIDGTIADVGGAFNQATLNNNFADLGDKYTKLRTLIRNVGLAA